MVNYETFVESALDTHMEIKISDVLYTLKTESCYDADFVFTAVLETKAGPSVRDQQVLVRTSNSIHISLQINV